MTTPFMEEVTMASEARIRTLSRCNAAIPLALLRLLGDFMSDLEADILTHAVKRAEARTAKPGTALVTLDDLREAAATLLADSSGAWAKRLRQKEPLHARRHAS
jgi:hypothetical protein